jgi:hypothetical protein
MKKSIVIISAVVVVVLVAGGVGLLLGSKDNSQDNTASVATKNAEKSGSLKQLDACTLFTEADAKAIMGASATTGDNTPSTESDDIKISNCSYTNNATAVKDIKVITVTSRSPLTQTGVDSNKEAFTTQRPSGAETVSGYGDDAYWDPATYQMAILKDNNWIAIVYGGTNPTNNTLADAKLVADKVISK